jgi:hypothetical protein
MNCGCQTEDCSCHDDVMAGYFLGALSPSDALEQVWPASKVGSGAGHNKALRDGMLPIVASGIDTAWISADLVNCSNRGGPGGINNLQLTQMASGLALTGVSIGLVAAGTVTAAALAPFTMGISALIGLFPMIFGHHAAAVKKEQSVLCAAVPAANNYLQIIDQAVQSGQVTPQHGIDALNSLYNDFVSEVASIEHGTDPTSAGECNAACVHRTILHSIVLYKSSMYQDMIATAASSQVVMPMRPNVIAPAGTTTPSSYASFYSQPGAGAPPPASPASDWLPIAAVLAAGFFLMKGM